MFPDERNLDDIDRYPLCINVSDEKHAIIYSKSIKIVKDWNVYPSAYTILALLLKCEEKNQNYDSRHHNVALLAMYTVYSIEYFWKPLRNTWFMNNLKESQGWRSWPAVQDSCV